jgi:hypothetical protein
LWMVSASGPSGGSVLVRVDPRRGGTCSRQATCPPSGAGYLHREPCRLSGGGSRHPPSQERFSPMNRSSRFGSPRELVEARRQTLRHTVGRPLRTPEADGSPLPPDQRSYLLDEARELYWNDLEWENVTQEEALEGGPLTELTFPGVLAFVRGLLLTEVPRDSPVGPSPRPQVVEDFLEFLAQRLVELESQEEEGEEASERELRMTSDLLDQVLLIYHGVSPEDVGPEPPEGPDGKKA